VHWWAILTRLLPGTDDLFARHNLVVLGRVLLDIAELNPNTLASNNTDLFPLLKSPILLQFPTSEDSVNLDFHARCCGCFHATTDRYLARHRSRIDDTLWDGESVLGMKRFCIVARVVSRFSLPP